MKSKLKGAVNRFARSRAIGPLLNRFCNYVVCVGPRTIVSYDDPKRAGVIDLVRRIHTETVMILGDCEAYQIFMCVERTAKIEGDIAEVGTYRGGSAKLICEAKGKKFLHVFDTFAGLPDLTSTDNPKQFHKGQFVSSYEDVKRYLSGYKNVQFYKGLFPATGEPVAGSIFSFVHLDVDLHDSTLDSLQFFYPRMARGGIIISHDYIDAPGVRKAFDDFFEHKPEPVIELSGSQCLVMKI